MIHVGTDKRRLRSAQLLADALMQCLEEKDFTQINVSDLQRKSGVSRATFYRLFDNIQDVLAYRCQEISDELTIKYQGDSGASDDSFLLFTLRYLFEHHKLLEAIFKVNRGDILQQALLKNVWFLKKQFPVKDVPDEQFDYLFAASAGILGSILMVWVRHGQKETPEELLEIFRRVSAISPLIGEKRR